MGLTRCTTVFGGRQSRIDVPLLQQTSFSPNGINSDHYADPRLGGLLMRAQQSCDSEPKLVYALSRKRIAGLDQTQPASDSLSQ
jgi:hypothetical protein